MNATQPTFVQKLRRQASFFAVALGALCAASGCDQMKNESTEGAPAAATEEAPPQKVGVYTVKIEPTPLIRELPGRTAAFNVAQVRPQVNGHIKERLFEEGSFVEEGQALYEIDPDVYKANFAKAQANVDSLERLKDRLALLKDKQATSEQEYEDALYAWESAKADLELARLNLEYCQIKAPIAGKIGFSSITVGALVTSGQANELTTIQQLDPIYVDINPSVQLLLQSHRASGKSVDDGDFWQNAPVEMILEDGTKYPHPGVIKRVDNRVQADVGTISFRAEFPNPNKALLPGMFVRAFVQEGIREDGKLIPQQALFRTPKGEPYVWVVKDDSTTERRSIVSDRTFGNMALVDSGLEAGERVVVEGTQYVGEGTRVEATENETVPTTKSFEEEKDVVDMFVLDEEGENAQNETPLPNAQPQLNN